MKLTKNDAIDVEYLINEGLITSEKDLVGDNRPSSVMFPYMVKKYGYLLNGDLLSEDEIQIRKKINAIIKKLGPSFLKNKQVFENRKSLINPDDTTFDSPIILPSEPVIWMPNHGFKDDPLASVLSCQRNAYFLFASLPQFYNSFDGITAWLNGVTLINRKVASSKKASVDNCVNVLNHGVDLILYPEGILNKSANELVLDLWPGIYRVAKATGAKVVPIVHYLRDKGPKTLKNKINPTKDDIIHTVVDDAIKIDDLSEKAALEYLRDVMATWLYLLIEKYGSISREELIGSHEDSISALEEKLQHNLSTMDYYDSDIEKYSDYRPKDKVRPEEVFESIANIEDINVNNVNDVVYDLVRAICHIEGIKTTDITIIPDDSIIENKNAEKTVALMEVQQGLKSKKSYLMKYEGMTEEQAEKELQAIADEKMTNQEMFGFPTERTPDDTNAEKKDEKEEKKEKVNSKKEEEKEE
mgnify:CR=1 FL=1